MSEIAEEQFRSVLETVEREYSSIKQQVEEKVNRAKSKALSGLKP